MLGPNKWRLLTIVAGILLAHAIDSPNRSAPRLDQQSTSIVASSQLTAAPTQQLGLTIERLLPMWNSNVRVARNLLSPYKSFSNVDDVRYVSRRRQTLVGDGVNWPTTTFGAFRYVSTPSNHLAPNTRRRSDNLLNGGSSVPAYEFSGNSSAPFGDNNDNENVIATTTIPTTLQSIHRRKYNYIPLGSADAIGTTTHRYVDQTILPTQEVQSRTDLNIFQSPDQPQALALQSSFGAPYQASLPVAEALTSAATRTSSASSSDQDIQGRRSGMSFASQKPKFDSTFQPQSYQEDDPSHPNFQVPYSEELSPAEPNEIRTARGATYDPNYPVRSSFQFPGPSTNVNSANKPFRDDVTKFGDVNGPVTSVQRQFSDFLDTQGIRTYENIYYSDDYRRPRQYYPTSGKNSFYSDYSDYSSPQPLRSRLIVPYQSSRSPRVIFPSNDNFAGNNDFSNNYNNNENVVFR